mgnify:CR=1 FL=1
MNSNNKELELNTVDNIKLNNDKNIYNAASLMLKDSGIKSKIIKQYILLVILQ